MPDPRQRPREQGGIPDGLLLGILALLLVVTVLTWTATGLSGLFAHGSWPSSLSFLDTPLALRHLISHPTDLPGAWPDTPPTALPGYGLFWGLFIGLLMILVTLTFFGVGTWARWKVVRARKRGERLAAREQGQGLGVGDKARFEPSTGPPAHHDRHQGMWASPPLAGGGEGAQGVPTGTGPQLPTSSPTAAWLA